MFNQPIQKSSKLIKRFFEANSIREMFSKTTSRTKPSIEFILPQNLPFLSNSSNASLIISKMPTLSRHRFHFLDEKFYWENLSNLYDFSRTNILPNPAQKDSFLDFEKRSVLSIIEGEVELFFNMLKPSGVRPFCFFIETTEELNLEEEIETISAHLSSELCLGIWTHSKTCAKSLKSKFTNNIAKKINFIEFEYPYEQLKLITAYDHSVSTVRSLVNATERSRHKKPTINNTVIYLDPNTDAASLSALINFWESISHEASHKTLFIICTAELQKTINATVIQNQKLFDLSNLQFIDYYSFTKKPSFYLKNMDFFIQNSNYLCYRAIVEALLLGCIIFSTSKIPFDDLSLKKDAHYFLFEPNANYSVANIKFFKSHTAKEKFKTKAKNDCVRLFLNSQPYEKLIEEFEKSVQNFKAKHSYSKNYWSIETIETNFENGMKLRDDHLNILDNKSLKFVGVFRNRYLYSFGTQIISSAEYLSSNNLNNFTPNFLIKSEIVVHDSVFEAVLSIDSKVGAFTKLGDYSKNKIVQFVKANVDRDSLLYKVLFKLRIVGLDVFLGTYALGKFIFELSSGKIVDSNFEPLQEYRDFLIITKNDEYKLGIRKNIKGLSHITFNDVVSRRVFIAHDIHHAKRKINRIGQKSGD